MEKPCINAGGYYSEYLSAHLTSRNLQNHTIVIASEELDKYPLQVAQRVARTVHYNIAGINISSFNSVRVNTQDNKGTTNTVSIDQYQPGRYNISHYQPLLDESRTLLNKCWLADCLALSKIPPYYKYTACYGNEVKGYLRAEKVLVASATHNE